MLYKIDYQGKYIYLAVCKAIQVSGMEYWDNSARNKDQKLAGRFLKIAYFIGD